MSSEKDLLLDGDGVVYGRRTLYIRHPHADEEKPLEINNETFSDTDKGHWNTPSLQSKIIILFQDFQAWLYPPHDVLPYEVQIFRLENIAIPTCYLVVGLAQGLMRTFLNVYPLDLGYTEAQQVTVAAVPTISATLKVLFGFCSDAVPLWGYRRKTYMGLNWVLSSASMFTLLFVTDLTLRRNKGDSLHGDDDKGSEIVGVDSSLVSVVIPKDAPSASILSLCFLVFGFGLWFADVMGDSLVAEKAKLEPKAMRGHLQSTCYACRFFGLMVSASCSTMIYSSCGSYGPMIIVILLAAIPLIMPLLIYNLKEVRVDEPGIEMRSASEQCKEIWKTICSRSVWQPLGFVYIYNVLQVKNAAWNQYLRSVLGFTANQLNLLLIIAYALLYIGIMVYKYFLMHWSWRKIYGFGIIFNAIFSASQVLLIKGMTFGLSPFLFALGDDAISEFILGIQFLPITIMYVHLCPPGSEGASYALFTSVYNSAYMVAPAISTKLLKIWDVKKATLEMGDLSGMTKLTILTSLIQACAIFVIPLMPRTREDLEVLSISHNSVSKVGGFMILLVVFISIAYTVGVGVYNVVSNG